MARDTSGGSTVVAADRDRVIGALLDVEAYPAWARAVKRVVVKERDAGGRPNLVEFRTGAFGRTVRYVLRYDHSALPDGFSWTLAEGDFRTLDGAYHFVSVDRGRTQVTYRMRVVLGFPLPGFLLRRAEQLALTMALKELKAYVEI